MPSFSETLTVSNSFTAVFCNWSETSNSFIWVYKNVFLGAVTSKNALKSVHENYLFWKKMKYFSLALEVENHFVEFLNFCHSFIFFFWSKKCFFASTQILTRYDVFLSFGFLTKITDGIETFPVYPRWNYCSFSRFWRICFETEHKKCHKYWPVHETRGR